MGPSIECSIILIILETWTHNIARLAGSPWNRTVTLKVDGPYGDVPDPFDFSHLILVCGGVGVTPMHSIVMSIYNQLTSEFINKKCARLQKVEFIWIAKTLEQIQVRIIICIKLIVFR